MTPAPIDRRIDTSDDRRLGKLDRFQPVVLIGSIGLGLTLAATAPSVADRLSVLVSIAVFLLIYLVMLGVDIAGVTASFHNRRFIGTAAAINFVINPLLAWGLAALFLGTEPDLRVGLILFLITPCIGWYLLFTELAGGDANLGVSLLAINVVLQILLLPLYLYVFVGDTVGVDLADITGSIALFLVLPLALAISTKRLANRLGTTVGAINERIRLAYTKTAILGILIVAMFASQADALFDNPVVMLRLLAPLAVFFTIAFGVAIAVGRSLGFPYEQTVLLVFTTTSRNSEASLAIAATAFASPVVALAVVIGPAIELPLLVAMAHVLVIARPKRTNPMGSQARFSAHGTP